MVLYKNRWFNSKLFRSYLVHVVRYIHVAITWTLVWALRNNTHVRCLHVCVTAQVPPHVAVPHANIKCHAKILGSQNMHQTIWPPRVPHHPNLAIMQETVVQVCANHVCLATISEIIEMCSRYIALNSFFKFDLTTCYTLHHLHHQ